MHRKERQLLHNAKKQRKHREAMQMEFASICGKHLVLPFIGPRSSRHLAGSIIDIALNPLNYFLKDEDDIIRISPTMLYAVSARSGNMETIDNLRETSIDYYSSLKSIYYQSRSSGLNESLDEQIFDDFFESLEVENKND